MFMAFFFCFSYMFFSTFHLKLVCLLSLEGLMLFCIWNFVMFHGVNSAPFSVGLIFMCFLVLDSVVGASLLVSMMRSGKNFFLFESL